MHNKNSIDEKELKRTTITIFLSQGKWLEKHPEFNLSGFVRTQLQNLIENYKGV